MKSLSPELVAMLASLGYQAVPLSIDAAPVAASDAPAPPPEIDHLAVTAALAPVVTAAIQANPAVANNPAATASVVSSVLGAVVQELPAALAISRASPKTTVEVSEGVGFLQLLANIFAHA